MVTLGLLGALSARGEDVGSAKAGPDYIDPAFHRAATRRDCLNIDPWCGDAEQMRARAAQTDGSLLVIEGAMGLFDGAMSAESPLGAGSTADVAEALGLPVILVIDAGRRAQTAAAIVQGLARFRAGVRVAGVILNRLGSPRHETMMRRAVETVAPVLGAIPRNTDLSVPSRHLGLTQASELSDLPDLLRKLCVAVTAHCDLDALIDCAAPLAEASEPRRLRPLGQRIAVARDEAFGFAYPHQVMDWRTAGAEVLFFSPLADEAPATGADAVFLPGGYPELFAGRIATADRFRSGMNAQREAGALIYGECGGYMTLGKGLTDNLGRRHAMLGFLDLETSFAERKLALGYRSLQADKDLPFGTAFKGHEFHYSTVLREVGEPLFRASPAGDERATPTGLRAGRVMGSYCHIVERA